MSFQEAANPILLEAERRIGELVMQGAGVENPTEAQMREAGRDFLQDAYNGQRDVSDEALNLMLSESGAGPHTPETEEMFKELRDMLLKGKYQAPEATVENDAVAPVAPIEPAADVTPPEPEVVTKSYGHNEITESILNNIAETMGGAESGWDVDRVKQVVEDITMGRMEQGDLRESFEAAVVDSYAQAPGGDAMVNMLENRSRLGGIVNEERMEHMAVGQLNGMINAYEQNLAEQAQQMQGADMAVETAPQNNDVGAMKL